MKHTVLLSERASKTRKRLLQFFTSTQRRASIERAESSTLLKDALRLYIQSHKAGCLGPRDKIHREWTYTAKLVNAHNCYLYSDVTRLFTIMKLAKRCRFTTGYFVISYVAERNAKGHGQFIRSLSFSTYMQYS